MRIRITYRVPTAAGFEKTSWIIAHTMKEAEEYCETCERLGYKIVDVTREA